MRYRFRTKPLVPSKTDGNLYYVRINTKIGKMYKLGFTSHPSVESRFSFKGNGDESLIEEILLFAYAKDAFWLEHDLHQHFKKKKAFGDFSAKADMPLYKNGQSELYCEDILGIDEKYTVDQKEFVCNNIRYGRPYRTKSEVIIEKLVKIISLTIAYSVSALFLPLFYVWGFISRIDFKNKRINPKPQKHASVKSAHQIKIENLLNWIRCNKYSNNGSK